MNSSAYPDVDIIEVKTFLSLHISDILFQYKTRDMHNSSDKGDYVTLGD